MACPAKTSDPTKVRRIAALAATWLSAIMIPIDPDNILRERRIFMISTAVADEIQPIRENTTPPARDPKVAVEEEYRMARQQGTVKALELFIARHPEGPFAEEARIHLQRLSR